MKGKRAGSGIQKSAVKLKKTHLWNKPQLPELDLQDTAWLRLHFSVRVTVSLVKEVKQTFVTLPYCCGALTPPVTPPSVCKFIGPLLDVSEQSVSIKPAIMFATPSQQRFTSLTDTSSFKVLSAASLKAGAAVGGDKQWQDRASNCLLSPIWHSGQLKPDTSAPPLPHPLLSCYRAQAHNTWGVNKRRRVM